MRKGTNKFEKKKYIASTTGKIATTCNDFKRIRRKNEHAVRNLVDRAAKY